MKEYKTYVPVALIILMFFSLMIFHKDIATTSHKVKSNNYPTTPRKASATRLHKNTTITITERVTITRSLNLVPRLSLLPPNGRSHDKNKSRIQGESQCSFYELNGTREQKIL